MQSLSLETRLYLQVEEKIKEMIEIEEINTSWMDVQFLNNAVNVLGQCRLTLKYSYVFSFFQEKSNQFAIFEDNQTDLETATENLSEYLEHDVLSENFAEILHKVQDKYRWDSSWSEPSIFLKT